jgi:hypothetical protein
LGFIKELKDKLEEEFWRGANNYEIHLAPKELLCLWEQLGDPEPSDSKSKRGDGGFGG